MLRGRINTPSTRKGDRVKRKPLRLSFREQHPKLFAAIGGVGLALAFATFFTALYYVVSHSQERQQTAYDIGYQNGYAAGTEHGIGYMWNLTAPYVRYAWEQKCLSDESAYCALLLKGNWPDNDNQVLP